MVLSAKIPRVSTIRSSHARVALLLGAALSVATPTFAQNAAFDAAATNATTAPLRAALAADGTPSTISASALDASWRRFKPNAALNGGDENLRQNTIYESFVTQGQTLSVGTETFLIAYRGQLDFDQMPIDQQEDLRIALEQTAQTVETSDGYGRLLPSQTLQLCLLNTRTIGGLMDVRSLDSKTDLLNLKTALDRKTEVDQSIAERAQLDSASVHGRVDSDLKQIGLALLVYTQDYDEKLPPMRSSQSMDDIRKTWDNPPKATVQQVLNPYLNSPEIFAHPTTREIYRPNLNLSGRSLAKLEGRAAQIVAFHEASPAPDGTRAVLYLDGHVRREPETNWANVQAISARFAPPFESKRRSVTGGIATVTTVTLYNSAAVAYMLRRGRDDKGRPQTVYLSKSTGRIYYRDPQTKQAIFLRAPAKGITIPIEQSDEFAEFQGYNGRSDGRRFGNNQPDMMTYVPRVKTALGADAAMRGSMIDVDGLGDKNLMVLRGTTANQKQRELATTIASRNAVGVTIVNQLVVGNR